MRASKAIPRISSRRRYVSSNGSAANEQCHRRSSQQFHRVRRLLLELLEGALARRFVRPPAQDRGAVTKAIAAEMIEADFDHELRLQRTPLRRTFAGPAAWAAWRERSTQWCPLKPNVRWTSE